MGSRQYAFKSGVEPPHPRPDPRTRLPLAVVEADQLVDEPLGVDPAQRVRADVELAGVVADDDGILEQAMGDHAAPQRAFGGDLQRIGMHPEPGDAEALEMGHPRLLVFEALAFVPSEPGDHQPREAPAAHVSQRLVVDHVVGGASPQKRQEVQPALRAGGGEPGKISVADVRAGAVHALVAGAGVIDRDPRRALEPALKHTGRLGRKSSLPAMRRRTTWRLEIAIPRSRNCATIRGTVTWPG